MNEILKGAHARKLLDDPVLVEAFDQLEEDYVSEWKSSTDADKREQAWHSVKALQDIRTRLRVISDRGQVAAVIAERRMDKRSTP